MGRHKESTRDYPEEEQGIVPENKHGDDEVEEILEGQRDKEVYDEHGREMLLDDDEISENEAAFARGYEEGLKHKDEKEIKKKTLSAASTAPTAKPKAKEKKKTVKSVKNAKKIVKKTKSKKK